MQVTNVRLRVVNRENDRIKAHAAIVFDDCFVVEGIKVVRGNKGVFVAMPSIQSKSGDGYQDIAHPINSECRKMVTDAVMKKYEEVLAKLESKVKAEDNE